MKITFQKSHGDMIQFVKFNPYHDRFGRFTSASSAASFTYSPGKSKAHDKAIARAKDKHKAEGKRKKKKLSPDERWEQRNTKQQERRRQRRIDREREAGQISLF